MVDRLWDRRKVGKPPSFSSPEQMWNDAVEYFNWCEENVPMEAKPFSFQGVTELTDVPKMRAMTQAGLCTYLNIGVSTYHDYKNKPEYSEVTKAIDAIMYEQKFVGAASGLLNANIIARDLGLTDRTEHDHRSGDGTMTPPTIEYKITK